MSVFAASTGVPRVIGRSLRLLAAGAAAALFAAFLTAAMGGSTVSLRLAIAGGVGLIAATAIAIARYEAAVWLATLLLAIVKVEPAPTDAMFLVTIAVGAVTGRLVLRRIPGAVAALLGLFLAVNLFAMTQSIDVSRTIRFSFITFYLALFAVWLVSWLDSERRARVIVQAYVAGAVLTAFLGAGALAGVVPGRSTFTYGGSTRAVALFKDPNVYGAFLVPAALILLDELLGRKLLRARRPLLAAAFLLCAVGSVLSFSRAAWGNLAVGMLVMILVYALRRGGARRALVLLAVTAGAVAVGYAVLSATGTLTFLHERAHLQEYDTGRFSAQKQGLALAEAHPFGVGPGQFESYVELSAHETYVRAVAELGFLGLIAIVGLLLTTLVFALRNAVLGRETYGIGSAPLLAAWCGLLFSGFFIDTLHWRHLWLVAALVWAGAVRPVARRAAF